ncbi:hypothetical protein [Cupriavidus sp. TMH.W2]|uniref:hypothetical protein n=1 Tax=Cupriavidus sp. TMH.W2 TaxID=3434465 RepID=UPI003D7879E2
MTSLNEIVRQHKVTLLGGAALLLMTGVAHAGVLADLGAAAYKAAGSPSYTTVIPQGYRLEIGGKATPVSGRDSCLTDPAPPSTHLWWMGGHPVSGNQCVVIGPQTTQVVVDVYGPDGSPTVETWKVVRQERNGYPVFGLQRENGEYIAATK